MSLNRDTVLIDAALAIYGHGFADVIGDLSTEPVAWTHAIVSPVLLRNVGEDDTADALERIGITRDTAVITEDYDDGSHAVYKIGDPVKVGRAWDKLVEDAAATTCRHCDREIVLTDGLWIDPQADVDSDDAVWRETCDAHDTMTAEHEPA